MRVDYERYWEERIEKKHVEVRPRHCEIVAVIRKEKGASSKILDLGCGEGHILNMLPESFEKYGCDISQTALNLINIEKIHCVVCDLNNTFPFEGEFDVIIASEVLEHLHDPYNLLEQVKLHLAKDGLFLATIPSVTHFTHRMQLLRGNFPTYDPSHVNFWDIDKFVKILQNHGYRVLHFYPTSFDIPFLGKFPNLLKKLPFFKTKQSYKLFGEQFLFICKIANK